MKLIVANWKMNPQTLEESKRLFNSVRNGIKGIKNTEIVICPPFIYLLNLKSKILNLKLGAQDVFWENPPTGGGAFTGEVSALMLKNLGVEYVIIGHSERRKYQRETNKIIEKKIKAALAVGLKPILCIEKISQLPKDIKRGFSIAYEPLFAIGTGKPCSIDKAKKMRIAIKKKLNENTPILYGGSVNSQNAKDYIEKAGFRGLLVGGASLDAEEFVKIVKKIDLISK